MNIRGTTTAVFSTLRTFSYTWMILNVSAMHVVCFCTPNFPKLEHQSNNCRLSQNKQNSTRMNSPYLPRSLHHILSLRTMKSNSDHDYNKLPKNRISYQQSLVRKNNHYHISFRTQSIRLDHPFDLYCIWNKHIYHL